MFGQKSRLEKAREAYLSKDKKKADEAHQKKSIQRAIHREEHHNSFNLPEIILGGQDGLVNVLGIILGLAAATADSRIVIIAGLAATIAESVSMAAVAYTSKLAEADYYQSEYEREKWEIENIPEGEREEIRTLYRSYGFRGKTLDEIITQITKDKDIWLKVMMEQELKLEPVDRKQVLPIALLVGLSAVIGSLIPLSPFFILPVKEAIIVSLFLSSLTLFLVGFYKAKTTLGRNFIRQGLEMAVIGMASAFAGYLVGKWLKY